MEVWAGVSAHTIHKSPSNGARMDTSPPTTAHDSGGDNTEDHRAQQERDAAQCDAPAPFAHTIQNFSS